MVGTPYYLSPELCAKQPYDKSIDIWSLGCVFYELFCEGRHPFNAKTLEDLVGRIQVEPVDYSALKYTANDARIEEMLRMMLTKNPKDRLTIDGLLCLPLIQEYIQEFVVKINNSTSHRIPRNLGTFSPSTTIRSVDNQATAFSTTNELLTTMQRFISRPTDALKINFQCQLDQAARSLPFILNNKDPLRLQKEAERVRQQLIHQLILPSRINQFVELVRRGDFGGLIKVFEENGEEEALKEIIDSGLIGDAFVMHEINQKIKK